MVCNKRILRIQSSFSNFVYQLPSPLAVSSLSLDNFFIYNSSYVVTSNNNSFSFRVSSADFSVSLPLGNYDSSSLASTLQSSLNAISGSTTITWTISANSSTMKFSITTNSSVTIFFDRGYIYQLLGFNPVSLSGTSFLSPNVFNLSRTPIYYLQINELPNSNNASPYPNFTVIYNNVGANELLTSQSYNFTPALYSLSNRLLGTLSISLRDLNGNLVDLNGIPFMLEFSYTV